MMTNYARLDRVGTWDACFQQVTFVQISEVFTFVLFWNIRAQMFKTNDVVN